MSRGNRRQNILQGALALPHQGCDPLRVFLLGERLKHRCRDRLAANPRQFQFFEQFAAKIAAQTLRRMKHNLDLPTGLEGAADMRQPLHQEQTIFFTRFFLTQGARLLD